MKFDVVVIGGGPAGYVAAIKGAQLGKRVACVEAGATLGGTCLNIGCIPSKALLQSSHKYFEAQHHFKEHGIEGEVSLNLSKMMERKEKVVDELTKGISFLFKKNGVTHLSGHASFLSNTQIQVGNEVIEADNFIIATGSSVAKIPSIEVDEKNIVSSTGALSFSEVPETLAVIGGGYIGLEMASIWSRLGSKVSVIEFADKIVPAMDDQISIELKSILEKQGIDFFLRHKVTKTENLKDSVTLTIQNAEGEEKSVSFSKVLVSVGRVPNTEGLKLDAVKIQISDRGFISVNNNYQTSQPNIYAIGDVIGGMMLAHKAEDEGVAVAEIIDGQKPHINYNVIPAIIYTHPEVACVGLSEQAAEEKGYSIKVGKFPMTANGRAKSNGDTQGFVKVITNAETDEILGVHMIGADAGAMIAEAALAMEYRASAEDIARTCHAHPTTAEAFKEAALGAWFKSLHS